MIQAVGIEQLRLSTAQRTGRRDGTSTGEYLSASNPAAVIGALHLLERQVHEALRVTPTVCTTDRVPSGLRAVDLDEVRLTVVQMVDGKEMMLLVEIDPRDDDMVCGAVFETVGERGAADLDSCGCRGRVSKLTVTA